MDRPGVLVFLILIIFTATGCSGQTFTVDPCNTREYKTINEPHRSTGFLTALPETPLCDDRLRRGWYRFTSKAGGEMPTTCQETNRCGTTKPIWLDGSSPLEEEGITMRKICVNLNSSEPQARSCCEYSEDIFVKNCGGFFVYYLYPTMDCDSAYCAGNIPPCPVGKWSNTSFPPCKDPFPVLVIPPVVTGPDLQLNKSFGFQCEVEYDEDDQDQRFEIVWTFNGRTDPLIVPQILRGSERTATLDISFAKNHVSTNIACQVRSFYVGREADKSAFLTSNSTYFGIKTPPVLTGPILPDDKSFTFQCEIIYDIPNPDQIFEVFWTFSGQLDSSLLPQIISGQNRTAVLDGALIKGHLNTNIGCQARLTYPESDIKTALVSSNTYFAGIRITPNPVLISEIDFEKYVTMTSTIPVICDHDVDCCLTFKLNVNETAAVSLMNSCEHRICSSDWNSLLKTASVKVGVVPTRNILVGGNKGAFLSFQVIVPSSLGIYLNVFQGYQPGQVQITVKDETAFKCSLTGDPHIMGFDFKYMYDLYKGGDFIAYVNHARDFMIQVRTVPCGGGSVACICGIVVRERNDVIKVSKCNNPNSGPTSIDIAYKLSPGTIVQRSTDGYRFGIYLPSGSEVKIESGGTNVYISVPAFDKGLGRGVCGTTDGVEDNDFTRPDGTVDPACTQRCIPDAFLESWRVTGNESLFEVVPDPVNSTDPVFGSSAQYCSCLERPGGNSTVTCSTRQHVQLANTACPNCPVITDILTPTYVVGTGWVRPGTNKPEPPFVHPEVKPVDTNKHWPNDQGVTEAQAKDICTQAMQKSQLFPQCQNMEQLKNSITSDCLADILFGGTTDFLDDITSAFTSKCQLILAQNPNNYIPNPNGDGDQVMKPELLDHICPIECLKHGQCGVKGQCLCKDGWEGETCLIESGKGPQLVTIEGGNLCDITQRSCDKVNIDITNINFLDKLQYRVQAVDEQGNNVGAPGLTKAVFLTPITITCILPALGVSTQMYRISATKNGTLFGNELTFRVFDGSCLDCDVGGCREKSTACHINNICYANGEADPSDGNRTCDISKSTSRWTTKRSEHDRPPILDTPPVLTGPNVQTNGSFSFQCELIHVLGDLDLAFEVVWIFNGQSDPTIPPTVIIGRERIVTLDITFLKGQVDKYAADANPEESLVGITYETVLGIITVLSKKYRWVWNSYLLWTFKVGCQARSYYIGYENNKGAFVTSNTTYFGIQVQPVLRGPILPDNKSFIFQCDIIYENRDSSQEIEVIWTFSGYQDPAIPSQIISGSNRSVILDGAFLMGHLGTRIGCQARLIFAGSDIKTKFIQSNTFFAGLQINPDPLEISEIDFEKYITVISTIPIICDHDLDCCLTFKLNVNETSAVTLLNSCDYKMCTSDWDHRLKTASIQVGVIPTRNILVGGSRNVYLALQVVPPLGYSTYLDVFQNYRPSLLQIRVKDETAFKCSMTGDPHIMGFDFKQVYDLYNSGDYIAYVARERDFMVQIRAVPCGAGAVSCICGIVVRERNDVIKVSKCESGLPSVAIAYKLSSGAIIQRSPDGNRIGIFLQSGSEVKIERGGTNIYISIPAFDKGLGRGLCGTNDGIQDNDFTHRVGKVDPVCAQRCIPDEFFESWRVTGNESLFEVVPDPVNITDTVFGSSIQYCSCLEKPGQNSTVSCSARQHLQRTNTACPNCPVITDTLTPSYQVGVGWVRPGTNKPDPPFVHPEVKPLDRNKQWPNDQGVTKDQAMDFCTDAIQKSQLYPQCQNLSQVINSSLSDCLADILYGGTTDFLDEITSAFTSHCQLILAQNVDNYVTNPDGDQVLKPELLEDVCPVECLKHGHCGEKGQCLCQNGWEGETCLIDVRKGPQLQEIKGGSLCDVSHQKCDRLNADIANVNFQQNLQCRVQAVDDQGNKVGAPVLTKAVFLTPETITCKLPALVQSKQRYNISATKDETIFGNELTYVVFDGTCLDCDITSCRQKISACHINNKCYRNGEMDKTGGNRTCDITRSTTKWTTARSDQDRVPILDKPPVLTGPNVLINGSFSFRCEVVYDGLTDPEQVFEVVWIFNGQADPLIPPQLLTGDERITTLAITLVRRHVDTNVGCQVRSYYTGYEINKSAYITSNTTYFGIQTPPLLTGPILLDNKSFIFQCDIIYVNRDSSQEIEVVWTFDNQQDPLVPTQVISGTNRPVVLDGMLLTGHLGTNVGCQARLIYPGSDVKTTFIRSTSYFVGIKMSPTPLVLSEIDFEKSVTISSTIPIICGHDLECCLTFKLNMNETSAVSMVNSCDHKMCSSYWDADLKAASIKIEVVPTRNVVIEGIKDSFLSFEVVVPTGDVSYLSVFKNYKPSILQVSVKDETAFTCSLTGDPHIMGFDFKHMYDLYKSGDFIAYTVPGRGFMIQVRTVPCGGGSVTCICGIVVRERNDVIKVSKCNTGPTSVDIAYKLSPGTIIQRSTDGYRFGIYLASGSEVKIESGGTNVYISVPAFDKGLGRGVCGTNDGIEDNDFTRPDGTVDPACSQRCIPDAFLESWRVTGNDSLFEVVPDPVNNTDTVFGSSTQYCSCLEKPGGNSTVTCSARQHLQRTNTACPNCPVITDILTPSYQVGVGWVRPGTNKPDPPFVHPEVKPVDTNKHWPNDQGVTEAQAKDICTQALQKSQLFPQCQNMEQLKNSITSDCLADILYGGTTDFLDDITSAFTSHCQLILAQNVDNYVTNPDGDQVLKPELLENICPVECLKHGHCGEKGQCLCQNGWEGETCLIEIGRGPELLEIKGGYQCDTSQKSCDTIHMDLTNINFSHRLQCAIQEVDEQGNKIGTQVLTTAVFLSPTTVTCTLPVLGQSLKNYKISGTTDGILFGNELSYQVFDGTCLECVVNSCRQKITACHIDNICYGNGDADQNDENRICDVTRSTTNWTLKNAEQVTATPEFVYPTRPPRGQTVKPCHFCFGG